MKHTDSASSRMQLKEAVKQVEERGKKAFETAKKTISEEKIQSRLVREALDYYSANLWFDVHHAGFLSLACEVVGGELDQTALAGAAMILFRAGIDIHDDIIDKQKMKTGKPTVYGRYGPEIAVLSGNAMLFKGFELMNGAVAHLPFRKREKVADLVTSAFFEIGDAVASELEFRNSAKVLPDEYYDRVVRRKAVGVEVHMEVGAILGNGTPQEIDRLSQFGRVLGIVAAVRDEIIDVYEPAELQDRATNEIAPLPILYALEDAQTKEKIGRFLRKRRLSPKDTQEILESTLMSQRYQRFKKDLENSVGNSLRRISHFRRTEALSALQSLATSLMRDL